jgi:hypothetical protein
MDERLSAAELETLEHRESCAAARRIPLLGGFIVPNEG